MSSTKVLVFVVLNLLTYKETHKSIPQIGTKYQMFTRDCIAHMIIILINWQFIFVVSKKKLLLILK